MTTEAPAETPSDLQATITETVAEALAATLPQLLSQLVGQLTGRPAEETPPVPTEPVPDPEREQVLAAEAEKARWDAMPTDELAPLESAARVQRWRDAHADLVARKGDMDILAELEADMTPAELKAAKTTR